MQGYSTWNAFHDDISEAHIREATDYMLQLGFLQAGYNYINIDGVGPFSARMFDYDNSPRGLQQHQY